MLVNFSRLLAYSYYIYSCENKLKLYTLWSRSAVPTIKFSFRKSSRKLYSHKCRLRLKTTLRLESPHCMFICTTKLSSAYWSHVIFNQRRILFFKRKYGIYRKRSLLKNRIQNRIYFLYNLMKNQPRSPRKLTPAKLRQLHKPTRVKDLDRMYFRKGRKVAANFFLKKKHLTQKYITKKIFTPIKRPLMFTLTSTPLMEVLIQTNIFYTLRDSIRFISKCGVYVNNQLSQIPYRILQHYETFSLIQTPLMWRFVRKSFLRMRKSLVKMKVYQHRVKFFHLRKKIKPKYNWISGKDWIYQHTFLYTHRQANIEFDWRIFCGVVLYDWKLTNRLLCYDKLDLSLFMMRSYNWKYLT